MRRRLEAEFAGPGTRQYIRERPAGLFCLDGRPHLKAVAAPPPDLSAYASLATGVAP